MWFIPETNGISDSTQQAKCPHCQKTGVLGRKFAVTWLMPAPGCDAFTHKSSVSPRAHQILAQLCSDKDCSKHAATQRPGVHWHCSICELGRDSYPDLGLDGFVNARIIMGWHALIFGTLHQISDKNYTLATYIKNATPVRTVVGHCVCLDLEWCNTDLRAAPYLNEVMVNALLSIPRWMPRQLRQCAINANIAWRCFTIDKSWNQILLLLAHNISVSQRHLWIRGVSPKPPLNFYQHSRGASPKHVISEFERFVV